MLKRVEKKSDDLASARRVTLVVFQACSILPPVLCVWHKTASLLPIARANWWATMGFTPKRSTSTCVLGSTSVVQKGRNLSDTLYKAYFVNTAGR